MMQNDNDFVYVLKVNENERKKGDQWTPQVMKKRRVEVIKHLTPSDYEGEPLWYANEFFLEPEDYIENNCKWHNVQFYRGTLAGKDIKKVKREGWGECICNDCVFLRCCEGQYKNGKLNGVAKQHFFKIKNKRFTGEHLWFWYVAKNDCILTKEKEKKSQSYTTVIDEKNKNVSVKIEGEIAKRKVYVIFHGDAEGVMEEQADISQIVDAIKDACLSKVPDCRTINIDLVACHGAMKDTQGNNLLKGLTDITTKGGIILRRVKDSYANCSKRTIDNLGGQQPMYFPLDFNSKNRRLIEKRINERLTKDEQKKYQNLYYDFFFIYDKKIYKIDYEFYNDIAERRIIFSSDAFQNKLIKMLNEGNIQEVEPDNKEKCGYHVIEHKKNIDNDDKKKKNNFKIVELQNQVVNKELNNILLLPRLNPNRITNCIPNATNSDDKKQFVKQYVHRNKKNIVPHYLPRVDAFNKEQIHKNSQGKIIPNIRLQPINTKKINKYENNKKV